MNIPTFAPHPLFKNGHAQTFVATWWRHSQKWSKHVFKRHKLATADDNILIVDSHIQCKDAKNCPDIILVHGFEGSSESKYMVRMAQKALLLGYNVHRMNLRSSGDSIHSCCRPYHAGLWQDIIDIMPKITVGHSTFIVGHSLGGNLVLKMAGDLGKQIPATVKAIGSISAPLNLKTTVDFLAKQKFYHKLFLGYIMKNYQRKKKLNPDVYPELLSRPTSLKEFDDQVICKIYNFKDADDYYLKSSSCYVLPSISIPTIMVFAQDDPIIPYENYVTYQKEIQNNHHIEFVNSMQGGHVAFIADSGITKDFDRFWADEKVFSFFSRII